MKTSSKISARSHANPAKPALNFSLLEWAAIVGVCLFFIIFPFQAGLFNGNGLNMEDGISSAIIYFAIVLLLFALHLIFKWELTGRLALLSILVFVLPLYYCLSSLQAVSAHNASTGTLVYLMMAAFFVFGLYLLRNRTARIIVEYAILLSCYALVIFGLLNMYGQLYYSDALWLADNGYRLTSVFQYSNTYAGFLSALLLAALHLMVTAERRRSFYLHAVMLVPILISIMLTFSRGALVILPVLLLVLILFLPLAKQLVYACYLAAAGLVMLAILSKTTAVYEQIAVLVQPRPNEDPALNKPATPISIWHDLALQGWGWMLLGIVIATAAAYAIHRWLRPWITARTAPIASRKYSAVFAPALLIVVGAIGVAVLFASPAVRSILPGNIADRLENINLNQHSVLERETFYRDALKVARDFPILGTGGGGWSAIYEEYQNNPYVSKQAHSYFVQTLVEVGWVGLALLLAFLIYVGYLFIQMHRKYPHKRGGHFVFFILAFAMLGHSALDFDMSYVYIACLVFFCLGAMLAPYYEELPLSAGTAASPAVRYTRFAFPGLLLILSVLSLVFGYRASESIAGYNHALYLAQVEKKPLEEVMVPLDKALAYQPHHPIYILTKADWLTQAYAQTQNKDYLTAAGSLLNGLKAHEPYNRDLILAQYRNQKDLGEYNQAIATIDEGVRKFQWDIDFYEAAVMEHLLAGQRLSVSDSAGAAEEWNQSLALYEDVLRRMEQLKSLPPEQLQGRNFSVTPFMRQAVGQDYYGLQQYEQAALILEPLKNEDLQDSYIRLGVRYYLAALSKLGRSDEPLKQALIAADPNEQAALDALTAAP